MTTQFVIDLAKLVNQIDPRISAYADGGTIKGCFRGKGKENYSYMVSERNFQFNNEGPNVRIAFEKAIGEITAKAEPKKLTSSERMKKAHEIAKSTYEKGVKFSYRKALSNALRSL